MAWKYENNKFKEEFLDMIEGQSFESEFKTKDYLNELRKLLQDFVNANTDNYC